MSRIDAITGGGNRRAQFIRDAVDEKLDREEAARRKPDAD
jgi:metal-responsive CopG/Arc/MetJ family transcriptional regulator